MSFNESDKTRRLVRSDVERSGQLQQIREALQGLRFGTVNVVVQDGVIIQVDRTVKMRLQRRSRAAGGNCSR